MEPTKDNTTGTAEVDDFEDKDPDDCYCESATDKDLNCISYAMGVDDSIYDLKKDGFEITEDDGDYKVRFNSDKASIWEKYIMDHIQDTYWNEYINLDDHEINFMIKENGQIERYINSGFNENPKLLAICNRLCGGDFKTMKDLLLSNDFYKSYIEDWDKDVEQISESHDPNHPYFGSAWGVMPRVFAEGYKPSTPSGYGPYHRGVVHKLNPTYSKVYHSSQKPLNIVDGFLTLNGPLYVSPYKSISSIFALRVNWESPELNRVPNREFMVNIGYKEWAIKDDSLVKNITEYIEYCDDKHSFEPFTVEKSGYVYEILVDDEVRDHIFASDKMIMNGREVCIDYLKKVKVNEVIPIKGNVTFESRKCPTQSLCDDRIKKLKEKGMISVNESYIPLSEFDHFFQEAKLKSKARNELDDSDFALVYKDASGEKIRKYPINDEAHVKAAARMFPRGVPNKYRKEVAGKILRRAHKFGIDTEGWKSLNNAVKD